MPHEATEMKWVYMFLVVGALLSMKKPAKQGYARAGPTSWNYGFQYTPTSDMAKFGETPKPRGMVNALKPVAGVPSQKRPLTI